MGTRAHIGMRESMVHRPHDDAAKVRFDFKLMGAAIKGGFHLGSIYLITRTGVKAKENAEILDAAAVRLRLVKGPWVIGGDHKVHRLKALPE